jgi:hypothetical protein
MTTTDLTITIPACPAWCTQPAEGSAAGLERTAEHSREATPANLRAPSMCRSRACDRACFCLVTDAFAEQTIDLVGVSPDGSTVLIYLVQSTAWTGSDAQVRSLQAKIQNYVGFALDGQLVRTYPKVHGLPWSIVVDCQTGPPDTRSAEVLAHAATAIKGYGGTLTVKGS